MAYQRRGGSWFYFKQRCEVGGNANKSEFFVSRPTTTKA